MHHQDAVILSRGADRAAVLAGETAPPGQGTVALFAEAALLRDQHGRYQDSFKLVCRAILALLESPPHGLYASLHAAPHESWVMDLRRLLWGFTRNADTGLPSSALSAKTEWHQKLLANVRSLLANIEQKCGLAAIPTLGQKLAKKGLADSSLAEPADAQERKPGLRVETVHQVKGESIGAVLYVAKKQNVGALLAGTTTEEGRIGYVAVTRARNLFWLAVPNSCLKGLRGSLVAAGFEEVPALK